MNVVGRFGSLLTQGVYSVATPFHPFGGAVDIVVVQQHDGTFKSTPWYVRFGKFQGVLKGTEKIVQIEVNGVEAKFNMHLDNSGEAYFLREIDPTKNGIEGFIKDTDSVEGRKEDNDGSCTNIDSSQESGNLKQDSTDFNCDEVEVRDERVTLGMDRFDRVDSDCGRIYYELPDEKSLEGSPEYSEYVDSRGTYTNLDSAKYALESQDSISEVILVSVDGHILTAPLSTSSSVRRDFELNTEQFDSDVGEGTEQYNRDEDALIVDYLNALEFAIENICRGNSETVSSEHHLKLSVGDSEHIYHRQDTQVSDNHKKEPCADSYSEVFGSCLELQKLAEQSPINDQENVDSSPSTLEIAEGSKESSYFSSPTEREHEHGDEILRDSDELPPHDSGIPVRAMSPQVDAATHDRNNSDMDLGSSDNWPVKCVSNDEELPQVEEEPTAKIMHSTRETLVSDEKSENEHVEPENVYLLQDFNPDIFTRLEISLCGHLLHAGMGLSAAQEAFDANCITMDEFKLSAKSILKNENLIVRIQGQYVPWKKAEHVVLGMAACDLNISIEPQDVIPVDKESQKKGGNPSPSRGWSLWSIPFRRVRTPEKGHSNTLTGEVLVDPNFALERLESIQTPTARAFTDSPRKQIIRSNVPSTDEIGSLNLKEGQNMVNFVFSTRVLGSQKVEAHIYLWKWNTRIVISDVDGTITKSDVLGQFMPLVGKDWTHSGIARLFSAIKENGYQLLFLSARAIVQSYLTKSFLFNLKQDGKSLPVGPVVISPDGLFPSLYREVIRRAPHEFKIACLEDIKALFPPDHNPFYAGFGNRDTDELSYRKIGIPKGKIFIINPKGEVAINHRIDVKSYTSLHTLVHDMFPPTTLLEQEDYNSWNYWKMPVPDIDNL